MLFRVGIRHVQSPTPYAGASNVRYICQDASLAEYLCHKMQGFRSRALWRASSTAACGVGDYPTPDLSQRASGSRYTSEKSVQFGPDGAPFP